MASDKKKATPEEARAAARALRKFWKAGRRSLGRLRKLRRQDPDAYRYGTKQQVLETEAAQEGTNADTMKKAWRVAQEYDRAQIEALCALVEEKVSRFSASHLVLLLAVAGRRRRDALTRRAIREGWGVNAVKRAVQAARGQRRPHVGRRPALPAGAAERLAALDALCVKWIRWCAEALPGLPPELQEHLQKATQAVHRVQKAAAAQLGSASGKGPRRRQP